MKTHLSPKECWAATESLHEAGLAMMRQRLAREHPGHDLEAEQAFRRWLHREGDPIPGDVAGPVHVSSRRP